MIKEIAGKVFKIEFEGSDNFMLINALDLTDAYTQVMEIEKSGDVISGLYLLDKDGFTQLDIRRGVKLNDITIEGVCHSNIFCTAEELELIDMVLYIDYSVDKSTVEKVRYDIDEEDFNEESLKDIFASYIIVSLDGDTYKKLDSMTYDELDYRVVSDVSSEIEEIYQDISDSELKGAFEMIKEYVKTDIFKDELKRAFDFEKNKA